MALNKSSFDASPPMSLDPEVLTLTSWSAAGSRIEWTSRGPEKPLRQHRFRGGQGICSDVCAPVLALVRGGPDFHLRRLPEALVAYGIIAPVAGVYVVYAGLVHEQNICRRALLRCFHCRRFCKAASATSGTVGPASACASARSACFEKRAPNR